MQDAQSAVVLRMFRQLLLGKSEAGDDSLLGEHRPRFG
jgi:hypothetical protein